MGNLHSAFARSAVAMLMVAFMLAMAMLPGVASGAPTHVPSSTPTTIQPTFQPTSTPTIQPTLAPPLQPAPEPPLLPSWLSPPPRLPPGQLEFTTAEAKRRGATSADMINDFDKALMVIKDVTSPVPVDGAGHMSHMSNLRFAFHTVNFHFRDRGASASRQFINQLPCGWGDDAKIAAYLSKCDPADLSRSLLRFTKSMPNTPQFFNGHRKQLHNMTDELGPPPLCWSGTMAGHRTKECARGKKEKGGMEDGHFPLF
jgi:hypothetical protein